MGARAPFLGIGISHQHRIGGNPMSKTNLFVLVLFFLCSTASAQQLTQTIKGTVIDRDTQEALMGASILVVDSDPLMGTITDLDGQFVLPRVPLGRQTLQISYIGYETSYVQDIDVTSAKQLSLEIALAASFVQSDEIVITPAKPKSQPLNAMAALSARQFTVEEADRYAGGLGDPARLASAFAGVASPSISSNGISVRGNSPTGLQWRIEGVEIPSPNHFADLEIAGAGLLTVLSNTMMDNSDFYTGAFPAEFGNASSGVFDMRMRTGNQERREHTAQASVLGVDLATEGPFRKGGRATYLANYRYSTMGLVAPFLPDDAGVLKYQDLSFKVNVPTRSAGTFSLFGIGALDGIDMEPADSSEWESLSDKDFSETDMRFYATGLSHKVALNARTFVQSTVSVSGNGLSFDEDRLSPAGGRVPRSRVDNATYRYTAQSSIDRRFGVRHTNTSGVVVSRLGYDLQVKEAPEEGAAPALIVEGAGSASLFQAYTQSQIRPSERLTVNAGLHGLYFGLNGDLSLEPRISATYRLSPRQDISLAYGLHSRIEPLPVYFVSDAAGHPNRELSLMHSFHYVLSYTVMLNDHVKLNIEPYIQDHFNVPVSPDGYVSTVNTRNSLFFDEALTNDGSGRNMGVDYTLEQYMNKGFYYLLSGSFFDATCTAADGVKRNTRFNKNVVFNALVGKEWRVGRDENNRLNANIRVNYLGGNRIEPIDVTASVAQQDVVYAETGSERAFSQQHPGTPIVSLAVAYRKNKPSHSSVWSLQILNATGAAEFEKDFYNINTGVVDTRFSTIMVPNISYRIDF